MKAGSHTRLRGRAPRAALGLALAAAISAVLVIAGCGSSSKKASSTPAALPAGLSVLATPAQADDKVPDEVVTLATGLRSPEFETTDLKSARRILANGRGWLMLSSESDMLCTFRVVASHLGFGNPPKVRHACSTPKEALEGRLIEVESLAPEAGRFQPALIAGVVPDGVESVTVIAGKGPNATAAVIRNGFEALATNPKEIRFTAAKPADRKPAVQLSPLSGTIPE